MHSASSAGILEQSMGARDRVGIVLYSIVVPARQATFAGGVDSLESILGSLQVKNSIPGFLKSKNNVSVVYIDKNNRNHLMITM